MAQVEAVRASENEAIKRLETTQKEINDIGLATQDALKRAEMADAAKKAVEGELKRWREREQKRVAETASRILADANAAQGPTESMPPKAKVPRSTTPPHVERKVNKTPTKKTLLPVLSSIFNKKKGHLDDNGSPSHPPNDNKLQKHA
ncbi:hypothetical protein HPP92_003811 [Vanilla planifolia]|uniref:Uncharacterized protein n=1 Tax=Vanilla planifolia TaxID=51239 RepID=A0A835VJB2_VANPL|nr:hypothetical protein HPP92_003811 [Vanilla planifolia]